MKKQLLIEFDVPDDLDVYEPSAGLYLQRALINAIRNNGSTNYGLIIATLMQNDSFYTTVEIPYKIKALEEIYPAR